MCKVADEMDRAYQEWVSYNHSWDNSKYLCILFTCVYHLPLPIIYLCILFTPLW